MTLSDLSFTIYKMDEWTWEHKPEWKQFESTSTFTCLVLSKAVCSLSLSLSLPFLRHLAISGSLVWLEDQAVTSLIKLLTVTLDEIWPFHHRMKGRGHFWEQDRRIHGRATLVTLTSLEEQLDECPSTRARSFLKQKQSFHLKKIRAHLFWS